MYVNEAINKFWYSLLLNVLAANVLAQGMARNNQTKAFAVIVLYIVLWFVNITKLPTWYLYFVLLDCRGHQDLDGS